VKTLLPIDSSIPAIVESIHKNPISIIQAPPGSGKTTRVAPALVSNLRLGDSRVYLLQPRRLAARSVAQRIAFENQWTLGQECGYHVRFDRCFQRNTQLIVATEGVLLRRLQDDATLDGTAVVVLDEFHERSLDADLLLGMLRQVQASIREDLRIVIMSATLNAEQLAAKLDNAPTISVQGRMFPVSIRYRQPTFRQTTVDAMTSAILDVSQRESGDILAFLPGQGEIHRVRDQVAPALRDFDVHALYGSLPLEEQTRIIEPGSKRKIVLSTNVAETSLTIEGIGVVIDSGLARVMRFDPSVGLDRLNLEAIAQDSATQRTGRAGRVAEGVCIRLWEEASQRSRAVSLDPEIRRVDLAAAVLQLFHWGHNDVLSFPWVTAPREEAVDAAQSLLQKLGAIQNKTITDIGRSLVKLPLHPRLGRMVLSGASQKAIRRVALAAAMLAERDPFQARDHRQSNNTSRGSSITTNTVRRWSSDIVARVEFIEQYLDRGPADTPLGSLNRGTVQSIVKAAKEIEQLAQREDAASDRTSQHEQSEDHSDFALMKALLHGFPDRVAKRRTSGGAALMCGGKAVQVGPMSGVQQSEIFLAIDVDAGGTGPNALVRQASAVELEWLTGPMRTEREELFFHPTQQQVVARRRSYWDDLILNETPMAIENQPAAAELLYRSALTSWANVFPSDDDELSSLVERCRWLKSVAPEVDLPELNEGTLHEVCRQLCEQRRSFAELKKAPWRDWLLGRFSNDQLRILDREAPRRIEVPSGSSIRIEYEVGKPPILAVKIQEVFSWKATPRLAFGRVPLLLHLLAPNQRPQQITDDLASFWATGYTMVKKDLKRRYPKHSWPDDPTMAAPTKR
jgi:ATP-dependent helicase HrpB